MYVEFESDGRSRKTQILTADGDAYIPASLGFPPLKTWHKKTLENPEAAIRIAGKRYPRRLQKIDDPTLKAQLKEQAEMKYGGGPDPPIRRMVLSPGPAQLLKERSRRTKRSLRCPWKGPQPEGAKPESAPSPHVKRVGCAQH
jgi:hypothetical protein